MNQRQNDLNRGSVKNALDNNRPREKAPDRAFGERSLISDILHGSVLIKKEFRELTKEEKARNVLYQHADQMAAYNEWLGYLEGSCWNSDGDLLKERIKESRFSEKEVIAAISVADKKDPQVRKLLAQIAGLENRYETISAASEYPAVRKAAEKALSESA